MKFDFAFFFETLPLVASKLNVTLSLTLIATVFSLLIGLMLALVSYYKLPVLSQIVKVWISFMRGTPGIAQLFFFYYGLARVSEIILNMSPVVAVAVVMSLNMGAFMSESIRAALLSVDIGQHEAAMSLGVGYRDMMKDIILPQAIKHILPSLVNEAIALLKESSILSYIGAVELLRAADQITVLTFRFFEPYLVIALIYYIFVMVLSVVANRLERWVNRSDRVS